MKKATVIRVLGAGNMQRVADRLGCSRQAVQKWATDEHDNILSRAVYNAVLAALVEMNNEHREEVGHEGERMPLDEATLADLMTRPPEHDEAQAA